AGRRRSQAFVRGGAGGMSIAVADGAKPENGKKYAAYTPLVDALVRRNGGSVRILRQYSADHARERRRSWRADDGARRRARVEWRSGSDAFAAARGLSAGDRLRHGRGG